MMVHPFFQAISTEVTAVELSVRSHPQSIPFTSLFAIFFPKGGYQNYGPNFCSWLNVISNHFPLYEETPHQNVLSSVEELFSKINVPDPPRHPKNIHVFHFWLYLNRVSQLFLISITSFSFWLMIGLIKLQLINLI